MSHPTTTLALLDALQEKWHQRFMALSAKDSEKRVGQAISEAANDLGDIIEAYESERLASDEPADQIRTLPEAISSRIVIPHASFSLEMTSDGISPDLYATLTGTATPAADIAEEPPVGSQVSVAQRDLVADELWNQIVGVAKSAMRDAMEEAFDVAGIAVADFHPLHSTTDADRERVGLTVEPAPADVGTCGNMESNAGDFPCSKPPHGDDEWHDSGRGHRWRVDEAPADVDPEPKAELDEVEALAMDLYHNSLLLPPVKEIGPTAWLSERDHEMWLGVARAAREHIEDEDEDDIQIAHSVGYEAGLRKAEANLARVTKERDEQTRDAIEWRNRHGALRGDVEEVMHEHRTSTVSRRLANALTRDTKRAES